MSNLPAEFSSLYFWLLVGATSIVFSMLGSYLRVAVDKALAGASSAARARSEARTKKWNHRVDLIAASPIPLGNVVSIVVWAYFSLAGMVFTSVFALLALIIGGAGVMPGAQLADTPAPHPMKIVLWMAAF